MQLAEHNIFVVDTLPASAGVGQVFYATDTNQLYTYKNSAWLSLGSSYTLPAFTTTDATPTIVYSYPIAVSQCVKTKVEYTAYKSDFTLGASGDLFSTFVRSSSGNIVRSSGSGTGGLDGIVQGNFSGTQPKPDLVANTSTQSIDVTLTGKNSITIIWQLKLTFLPYN